MTRSVAVLPYRTIAPDVVSPEPAGWRVIADGISSYRIPSSGAFRDWDAQLTFALEREFAIRSDFLDSLGLPSDTSCCEFVVTASTASGLHRFVAGRFALPERLPGGVTVRIHPPSGILARDLLLTSGIYLVRGSPVQDPVAPSRRGSRLWEHSDRIRLEGGSARLPMYQVSFARAYPGAKIARAEFHVELRSDPDLDFESAVIVYLNSDRPDFVASLSQGDPVVERQVWRGIVRRVVASALFDDWWEPTTKHEDGTLGNTVSRWARQIFGNRTLEDLRTLARNDFSRFEAGIDSWFAEMGDAAEKTSA